MNNLERAVIKLSELCVTSEIAKGYVSEKEFGKASGRKKLRCPDSECQDSIVRYCHGEVKGTFFAHLSNECCDYALFDRIKTYEMRELRQLMYVKSKNKGYRKQEKGAGV